LNNNKKFKFTPELKLLVLVRHLQNIQVYKMTMLFSLQDGTKAKIPLQHQPQDVIDIVEMIISKEQSRKEAVKVSILPTSYAQILRVQIPKAQKI